MSEFTQSLSEFTQYLSVLNNLIHFLQNKVKKISMEWQKEAKKNSKLIKSACLERLIRLTSVWVGLRNGAIVSKPDSVAKACDMNFLTEKLILPY